MHDINSFLPQPRQETDLALGLDIGSTTIKAVVLNRSGETVFSCYRRHFSDAREHARKVLEEIAPLLAEKKVGACVTGSGGIAIAEDCQAPFMQEVLACNLAIEKLHPDADVAIELGGEDAKVTYLTGGLEQRMNETCAGGTGAFIDQMAAFLGVDAQGLDKLAAKADTIYPIASRCGVFAKTDILPLLNEGCKKENIAASIMQAVVNQTISGLAQGRPIRGKVIFLGGPIHFLPSLRQRFQATLEGMQTAIFPDAGHSFVALGAAFQGLMEAAPSFSISRAIAALGEKKACQRALPLKPLFQSKAEYQAFQARHKAASAGHAPLETARGRAWLGFDSGSTTFKTALIDQSGQILYSSYQASKGDPLRPALQTLKEIYQLKPADLKICGACATGYGSAMLCKALRLDLDEVETVAHSTAAAFFDPDVSFIIDIGGQDIKCMRIENGAISRISLNEACSAGCGSFLENFAQSLSVPLPEFVNMALFAPEPADLGTRCTVFMNSRVKQAQKEGQKLENIIAGLCWSVIRNAFFKIMKITDASALGERIVAQGGAFLNDALLRALELQLEKPVTRPPVAGLMGAFGAALIAKKRLGNKAASTLLTAAEAASFQAQNASKRCSGCSNACLLTVSSFGNGRKYISGNRCERGVDAKPSTLPNLADWKLKRLFDYYQPLQHVPRGVVGIPRCLNFYENYPLWFTLFTKLGFRVQLSSPSSRGLYYAAFDTIPSQTVCYPAKLAHGHILDLIQRGVKTIFFPCIPKEQSDADFQHGLYNCPVVAGYPELLATNISIPRDVMFIHNFLPLERHELANRLHKLVFFGDIPKNELEEATQAAFNEMDKYRQDLRRAGEHALEALERSQKPGIIIAGHPYHIDPEVQHGIARLITSCGSGALTEDSIAHLMKDPGALRVVDQWAYHSRLYRAGAFAASLDNLAVLQLVSFGCGLDAVTTDQLEEIVTRNGRLYAQIKIDENSALGPARIRIRSLLAAMRERRQDKVPVGCARCANKTAESYPVFEESMRHTHTLLVPQMSPIHWQFAREIFAADGYTAQLLPTVSRKAIETGLGYVNNDACFPAIIIVGQLLDAIKNGDFDSRRVALVISQTGGGCRATNYLGFLRKALHDAHLEHVPIINFATTMSSPGIKLSGRLLKRVIMAGHYGDALQRMLHRLRPYETEPGSTQALVDKWSRIAALNIIEGGLFTFQRNIFAMIREFDKLGIVEQPRRPAIGIVGEILLKYHPDANNHAVRLIEEEGGEAVTTHIMDFLLYCLHEHIFSYKYLAGTKSQYLKARAAMAFLEFTGLSLRMAFKMSRKFDRSANFTDLRNKARKIISLGHQFGEGWLLGGEMMRMIENGVSGILCLQPFGCLPNHIVGKGLIRELKRRYPQVNITALDYDASASEVNQLNRIKLMMRNALHRFA